MQALQNPYGSGSFVPVGVGDLLLELDARSQRINGTGELD